MNEWIGLVIGLSVGLGLTGLGLAKFIDSYLFERKAVRTSGQVVRLNRRPDDDDTMMYYSVVRFVTEEGHVVEVEGDIGTSWRTKTNVTKSVYYYPDEPHRARVGGIFNWGISLIFTAVGLIITIVFVLTLLGLM